MKLCYSGASRIPPPPLEALEERVRERRVCLGISLAAHQNCAEEASAFL
jgi:hypothetical protein